MRRLLFLALLLGAASAEEEPKPPATPPPPSEEAVKAALAELRGRDPERFLARLEAIDVAERAKDPAFLTVLFDCAVAVQQPDFAVRAGDEIGRASCRERV